MPQARRQRIVAVRHPELICRIANRPVPGAAAQVAAQRMQVEPVRPDVGVRLAGERVAVRPGHPVAPVVLPRHAADEAGRAVAALRPAARRHDLLHRVQRLGGTEALGGHDLLSAERLGGDEARVHCGPRRARGIRARRGDEHRARAALALGAPLFASGQAARAQPVEGVGVHRHAVERAERTVDGDFVDSHLGDRFSIQTVFSHERAPSSRLYGPPEASGSRAPHRPAPSVTPPKHRAAPRETSAP